MSEAELDKTHSPPASEDCPHTPVEARILDFHQLNYHLLWRMPIPPVEVSFLRAHSYHDSPMPGKHCALPICSNRQGRTSIGSRRVVFHPFPKDMTLRKQWIDVCRAAGACKPDSYFICSDHFRSQDYIKRSILDGGQKRKVLHREAVPSQNLCGPRSAALFQVKEARNIKRFWALDELRQRPPYNPQVEPTKARTYFEAHSEMPLHHYRSMLLRPRMNPERCERCLELEEKVELLMIRNNRLKKRIGTLEAEILMLIE